MGEGRFQSTSSSPPSETVVDSGRAGSRVRQGALAGEPWYQEVIELRKQANDYKVGPALLHCTIVVLCSVGDGGPTWCRPTCPTSTPSRSPYTSRYSTGWLAALHCAAGRQAGVAVRPRPRYLLSQVRQQTQSGVFPGISPVV